MHYKLFLFVYACSIITCGTSRSFKKNVPPEKPILRSQPPKQVHRNSNPIVRKIESGRQNRRILQTSTEPYNTINVTNTYLQQTSNCFSLTYFDNIQNSYTTPAHCASSQPYSYPGSCLNESDIVYDDQGQFSGDNTFYACLDKIDQASMPTYWNGKYNGCLMMFTTITLLNLVEVMYFVYLFIFNHEVCN